ncbi:aminoglycoside phosphotransferase [Sphingobacterium sp. CZ-UAM]|nr:aminoglycoside phosphotransferase [Sphingobacterium sp. CZ-UAM]
MTNQFPTINSTLSPNGLCKLIQAQYGLSDRSKCTIIRLAMNHLYAVQDREKLYVFRAYTHNWRTIPEIEEELRLLTHLKENGGQVAFPIADLSDKYIQEIEAPEGKRFGVLFSFAKGKKTAKFSEETSFLIGQALAKVHCWAENFELKRMLYNAQNMLKDPIQRIKRFYNKNTDEIQFLENLSSFLILRMNSLDRENMRFGSVHLDIWFDNMHIDQQEGITFFDFDFCGNGYLCFDISYFLFQLLATHMDEQEYQQKAASFLRGYETVATISAEEKKCLDFACLAIMIYYISVQCDRFDYWTNIFLNEDHLKRMVGNLKRWISYCKIEIG